MPLYPKPASLLIDQLSKLPGVGKATAQRLAFFILKSDNQDNIKKVKSKVNELTKAFPVYGN